VWEWPERRGLEHLRLFASDEGTKADGLIVADSESGVVRARYSISLGPDWQLQQCGVFSISGSAHNSVWLRSGRRSRWEVDGKPRPDLENCTAFDITDTPFPKTVLVRSFNLVEGASAKVTVARIDNRELSVRPVEQEWELVPAPEYSARRYRCKSLNSAIEMDFDEQLMLKFCPQRWRLVNKPELNGNGDD